MAEKSQADLEADRLNKYMSPRTQGTANVSQTKITINKPQEQAPVQEKKPTPNWKEKQALQQKGVRLDGNMDLSVRVGHLNGLYEQGAINDEEYNKRAEALHVAREILDAVIAGNVKRLEELFEENPNLDLNNITENESTLLHIAVSSIRQGKSNPGVLKALLDNRMQVDKKKDGATALLSLCERPNFATAAQCASTLISYGADARISAVVKGKGGGFTCVIAIIEAQGPADLLDVILKAGGNPNDQCEPHGPLLNHCIIEGFDEQAKVLLNNGANPNTVEKNNGACALASAITNGSVEVVRLLLEKRANVNAPIMRDQKVTCKELAKYVADKKPGDANHAAVAKLLGH